MHDTSDKYLLMIEPDGIGKKSDAPVDDEITEKVKWLYNITKKSAYGYKGFHITLCGNYSDNYDHLLPDDTIMNSLCVYYVRYYRNYIPQEEFVKIDKLYDKFNI